MNRTVSILIVDEDILSAATIETLLAKEGYKTTVAENGEQALMLLSKNKYSLVITGLLMKDMHGLGILAKVKETNSQTPVIVMTGFACIKSAIEALRLGAYDYLIKPCENEELLLRVSRALEKAQMERQLIEAQKKSMFTATVITANHEINQPLTAIYGATGLIEMELGELNIDNPSINKQLQNIFKSAQRISDILMRMKRISQPILKQYSANVHMIKLEDTPKLSSQPTHKSVVPKAHKEHCILVIDDEESVRNIIADTLSKLNYKPLHASNALEALDIFKKQQADVDLVISDMKMPRMNGNELYHKLKQIDKNVRIILSSGYDVDSEIRALVSDGTTGFLRKPFSVEQLTSAINTSLGT